MKITIGLERVEHWSLSIQYVVGFSGSKPHSDCTDIRTEQAINYAVCDIVTCAAVEEVPGPVEKQRRREGTQPRLACRAGQSPGNSALNHRKTSF